MRRWLILALVLWLNARTLAAQPKLAEPNHEAMRTELVAGVYNRLEKLLEEIPKRWESLPESRVSHSGKKPDDVVAAATEEEARLALSFISTLALLPHEKRQIFIESQFAQSAPSEVYVWFPGSFAQGLSLLNRDESALVLEAWLLWAEEIGRKDALFWAATDAFDALEPRQDPQSLAPLLERWTQLVEPLQATEAKMRLTFSHMRALSRLGETQAAFEAYRKAIALVKTVGGQLGQGKIWEGKGVQHIMWAEGARPAILQAPTYWVVKDTKQAIRLVKETIDNFNKIRSFPAMDSYRVDMENRINPAYDELIPSLLTANQPHEALEHAEGARSRVLLDLLLTRHSIRMKEATMRLDLEQQTADIETQLARIDQELAHTTKLDRRKELLARRQTLDDDAQKLDIERDLSAKIYFGDTGPMTYDELAAISNDVGPVVLYYVAVEETITFLILPEAELLSHRQRLSWRDLSRQVDDLADKLANPNYEPSGAEPARALSQDLLGPIFEHLPTAGPLTIIPHGPLHQLPFEALPLPDGRCLFEHLDLAVAPSLSALRHLRGLHQPAKTDDGFLTFASGAGLTLPLAEIAEIAALFDPKQTADFRPTMARFDVYERLRQRARHLLFATQGAYAPGNQRETYLEIQGSDAHDSRLTAAEIANLPIAAELVTLAACDTARGEALLSDERLDLARAFLVAGTASVLATRWKIPEDAQTSRFLLDFYTAYRKGGPEKKGLRKDQAVTEARRRSIERGDPAQVWAAWVLIGDAR